MKKLTIFALLIVSAFVTSRCDNTVSETPAPDESLKTLLSEIALLGEAEKKIITFDLLFDKHSNTYSYTNVEILKESKKMIDFVEGADPGFKYQGGTYEVECTDASGAITTTNCNDYACVGYAVASCVEGGGCAQVCKAKAQYNPTGIQ